MQMTPPLLQKVRGIKETLDEGKRGLKLNMQKTKIIASSPITSQQIDEETMETAKDFIFLGSKITASLLAQRLKHLPAMWETWVRSLGQEDPLEKEMATHSSTLAWRIPWMEEPSGLQSTGSQRVGHD